MDRETSHSILNELERLKIMHDLLKDEKFTSIPKEEIQKDAQLSLDKLKSLFNNDQ